MQFIVHGYTETGAEREITVDAATQDDAATIARRDGVFPDRIRVAPAATSATCHDDSDDSPSTKASPQGPPLGGIVLTVVAVIFAGYIAIQIISAINPFEADPNYSPKPFTEYKTDRERLQEYHNQGRFLGYPLSDADQWAEDMDALHEARKSEYYAP